ncbi:hypothetical protein, partial [Bacillus mycoides]|uniref:hypothetical protein n=1 Tax=Bacillus mycoides TaxID=1405 RepID=UPI0021120904
NIPCIILLISFSLQFRSAQKTLQQNLKDYLTTDGMHTETATLSAEDIYDIFVASTIPLPPYLALDSKGKSVVMTEKTTFNIQGQGGYYSRMQVKFVPKDKTKQPSIMPYAEYVQKVKQRLL